jgi:hypothetical protein
VVVVVVVVVCVCSYLCMPSRRCFILARFACIAAAWGD